MQDRWLGKAAQELKYATKQAVVPAAAGRACAAAHKLVACTCCSSHPPFPRSAGCDLAFIQIGSLGHFERHLDQCFLDDRNPAAVRHAGCLLHGSGQAHGNSTTKVAALDNGRWRHVPLEIYMTSTLGPQSWRQQWQQWSWLAASLAHLARLSIRTLAVTFGWSKPCLACQPFG